MRFHAPGFIICHIILQSQARKFGIKPDGRIVASESRYRPVRDYADDYPSYDVRDEPPPPVTFQAPRHSAHDYWRYKHGHDNRRTFFEDLPYGDTTSFPGFFRFVTSMFGGRDESPPLEHPHPYHYDKPRATQPYPVHPHGYRPTEPNYIPPPKPIRASVIKLETITRSPNPYPFFEQEMTTRYYPHAGSILKHVLIENAKAQPESQPVLPFKPLPVLPRPVYVPATTLKPTYRKVFNHTRHAYNDTDFKYPESVQDQLPDLNVGEVKIPYEPERALPNIFNTLPTQLSSHVDFYPRTTTDSLGLIDIRSIIWPEAEGGKRPVAIEFGSNATNDEPRMGKSFPGAVEKVERPVIKFTKKVSTKDRAPVERVTNLTVEGLSNVERDSANIRNYVNRFNMRNLISYELGKFNASKDADDEGKNSTRVVDIDDELSLDAKILKDTNWDGLTVPTTTTTTEIPRETTTLVVEIKPKTVTRAFWEIGGRKGKPETTTEPSSTETFATEESTTPLVDRRLDYQDARPITEETVETTTLERTTPSVIRRRYSRRPKILTFTPYPTPEELQKKLVNRNHFAKRQKPNISLAFGNKNIVRREGRLEVMKFSDEDVKRRRKIGKRRQVYKRARVVTSERPGEEEWVNVRINVSDAPARLTPVEKVRGGYPKQ